MQSEGSEVLCFIPHKSPYQRLSQWMLDISGDRGVLKDVVREGAGELVTPDASVLGIARGLSAICPREAGDVRTGGHEGSKRFTTLWGRGEDTLKKRNKKLAFLSGRICFDRIGILRES